MTPAFKIVIPARFGSQRLPGKPLLDIAGKAMILHVCERAHDSGAQEIVVASDDQRIADKVQDAGFQVMMTRPDHASGTERIAEVISDKGWQDDDIVVNLQGDEPLVPVEYINDLAAALASQTQAGIATLAANIDDSAEIFNPNAVKVVLNSKGYALYFSRAPIPWDRENFSDAKNSQITQPCMRHIGMYAYRCAFVKRYISWEPSQLENIESLEQLRILWQGQAIKVVTVPSAPEAGVDTLEDLQRVEKILLNRQ